MSLTVGGKSVPKSSASGLKNIISKVKTAVLPTKAKLTNVVQTVKAAVTGKGVTANTGNKTADKVLSAAASNPFTTALVGSAVAAPTAARLTLASGVKALPTSVKVAGVVAAPAVASYVISNPASVSSIAKAPSALASFGGNVGAFSANPSLEGAKQIFKDNPVISSAVLAAGVVAVGAGTASVISNAVNTQATRANTAAIKEGAVPAVTGDVLSPFEPKNVAAGSPIPITPATQILGKPASTGVVRRRKAKKMRSQPSTNIRVNVLNANQSNLSRRSISY